MNGVRRFFAASNAATSSSPPPPQTTETATEPPVSPPVPPPLQTTAPLSIAIGKQVYPSNSDITSPIAAASPPLTPRTTTAGLFIRKDGPGSPRRKPVNSLGSPEIKSLPPRPPAASTSPPSSARKPVRALTPPIASTSSLTNGSSRPPPPARVHELSQPAVLNLDNDWKQTSMLVNTRDDLLMSLLASEAVVDSRGFEILSAEEVEELKREQQLLSSRLVAMRKKVALETKIRDAAVNLQKLQTVKRLSKQTSEQVDAGNRKVDVAAKELSRLLERASDVDRKLLEHRAGVLSFSVRNLEAKISPGSINGETTDDSTSVSRTRTTSQALSSPTSSITSMSTRAKFDGAHLFAGHADTVIPGPSSRKLVNPAQLAALEEKLKAAEEAAEAAEVKDSELRKQVKLLELEKSNIETTLTLDLQTADETISKLEREMTEMESAVRDRETWDKERQTLTEDLESRIVVIEQLEKRVRELVASGIRSDDLEKTLLSKNEEIRQLRDDAERERAAWERRWSQLEQERQEEVQRIRGEFRDLQVAVEELNASHDALRSIMRSHNVPTSPAETSFRSLTASLETHLASLDSRLAQSGREKTELENLRRKYEEDVRNGLEIRERLGREIDDARKEREEFRREVRLLETRIKDQSNGVVELANIRAPGLSSSPETSGSTETEHNRTLVCLRGLWAVLPSVEARVSKMAKGNSLAPSSPGGSHSLSDLDVRALKSLYDPKVGFSSPTVSGEFSVEDFVARVQALIADDRALVERLIRFAQSHDLLRNNAERAQKLAQDSNKGLEMYQMQVKSLEERNGVLGRKELVMLDEISRLQQTLDQVLNEKRELEVQAIEQSNAVQNLTQANNRLSARALAIAEEVASTPTLKAKLESQVSDLRAQLEEAQDEITRMRSSESTQRVTLLNELNELQQENGKLRDQLRAKK